MNAYLSTKIRVITLITMVLLTLVHAYTFPSIRFDGPVLSWEGLSFALQYTISQGLAKFRLPMFFILSGYFFIHSVYRPGGSFIPQFLKRIRTVALPYLLWSAIGFLIYLVLQWPEAMRPLFPHNHVWGLSFHGVLRKLLLDPIPYQLWFLRDLMVLFALSPLIHACIRRAGAWVLVPPLLAWLFEVDLVILADESLAFFMVGGWLALRGPRQEPAVPVRARHVLVGTWIMTVCLKTALVMHGRIPVEAIRQVHHLCVLLGLLAVWMGYDLLMPPNTGTAHWIHRYTGYSFFIYAAHEPCLTMVKHGLLHVLGGHPLAVLLCYFLAPLITILLCYAAARLLLAMAPAVYGVLTGGRGLRTSEGSRQQVWIPARAA